MRQRKIKDIDNKIDSYSYMTAVNPKENKGKWNRIFENDNPIYLEIGCGKGKFITTHAEKNKNCNYIAVEGSMSVVIRAFEKAETMELENIRFVLEYINDIRDYFEKGELAGIYLNFSDPWPKERHAKRRLTYGKKLKQYKDVVSNGGFIQFKTDNDMLFDYTLTQIEENELKIEGVSRDLHNCKLAEGNIMTEYEEKFSSNGKNINYVRIEA